MKLCPLLLIILFLAACGDSRGVNHPPATGAGPHVGALLCSMGSYAIWAGGCGILLASLGFVASFIPYTAALVAPFRAILVEIAVLGAAAILVGSSFVWVGDHVWVIAATTAVVVAALAIRYRARWLPLLGITAAPPLAVATPLTDYQKAQIQKAQA